MPFLAGLFARASDFTMMGDGTRKITAAHVEEEFANVANGLSQTLLRDGSAAMTGDLDLGGQRIISIAPGSIETPSIGARNAGIAFGDTIEAVVAGRAVATFTPTYTGISGLLRVGDESAPSRMLEMSTDADGAALSSSSFDVRCNGVSRLSITDDRVVVKRAGDEVLAIGPSGSIGVLPGNSIHSGRGLFGQALGCASIVLMRAEDERMEFFSMAGFDWIIDDEPVAAIEKGQASFMGGVRATGAGIWPNSGAGVEFEFTGGTGYVSAVDRDQSKMAPMVLRAETVSIHAGGSEALKITAGDIAVQGVAVLYTIRSLEARLAELERKA